MSNINIQNAIRLVKVQFPDFNISSSESEYLNDNLTEELNMNLSYTTVFSKENINTFIIEFELNLFHETNKFTARFKMIALFETKEPINEAFEGSPFVNTNAPAIAFPFLRSFVSTITLNAGFKSVILPSINLSQK